MTPRLRFRNLCRPARGGIRSRICHEAFARKRSQDGRYPRDPRLGRAQPRGRCSGALGGSGARQLDGACGQGKADPQSPPGRRQRARGRRQVRHACRGLSRAVARVARSARRFRQIQHSREKLIARPSARRAPIGLNAWRRRCNAGDFDELRDYGKVIPVSPACPSLGFILQSASHTCCTCQKACHKRRSI